MNGAHSHGRLVIAIGVFKILKATVLTMVGIAALMGLPDGVAKSAVDMMRWSGALSGHHAVGATFARFLTLTDRDVHLIGAICLAYATLFVVEGVGLLERRRWAEWLTVIVTSSFIPFEIYELARRPGPGKVVALALNGAIAAYLAARRVRAHADAPRVSHFRAA